VVRERDRGAKRPAGETLSARTAADTNQPSVSELLDKYAETQDKVKSYICKCEISTEMDALLSKPPYSALSGKNKKEAMWEFRYDGSRYSERFFRWGNMQSAKRFIPKNEADYNSILWDGTTCFSYYPGKLWIHKHRDDFGRERWIRHQKAIRYGPGIGALKGFWGGRIDVALRNLHSASVRDKTDNIKGAECYVIDAVTGENKYTIWIDPSHGYNIVKLEWPDKKNGLFCSLENVSFEKINNIWIPMKADNKKIQKFPNGDFSKEMNHIKVTEMILDPNQDALRSFSPDDVRNGAIVSLGWDRESQVMRGRKGKYEWQDGQVVDTEGHKVSLEPNKP